MLDCRTNETKTPILQDSQYSSGTKEALLSVCAPFLSGMYPRDPEAYCDVTTYFFESTAWGGLRISGSRRAIRM